jgi:antitoxin HigA-1
MSKIMPPIHPGEMLREEFLEPMEITAYRLAHDIDVPESRISEILREKRAVSADTALRLSRYFGMSESYWTNIQAHYDREIAKERAGDKIDQIHPLSGIDPKIAPRRTKV